MSKLRLWIAGLCAAFLALSAFAHSGFGWHALSPVVREAGADEELVTTLGIAWRLGGAAMFIFAALVVHTLVRRRLDPATSLAPLWIVGGGYAAYGGWAFVVSGYDPFFAVLFVVPGVALAATGLGVRAG